MIVIMSILVAVMATLVIFMAVSGWRAKKRSQAIRELIDGADDMERLLHDLRDRVQQLQGLLEQIPGQATDTAKQSLTSEQKVQSALRDVLQHRLWIQQHGETASESELTRARDAMSKSRHLLDTQIERLKAAGRDLETACQAAHQSKEPESADSVATNMGGIRIEAIPPMPPPGVTRH